MRRTYSSLLTATGDDVNVVQELTRHAEISTTMEVYAPAGMEKSALRSTVDLLLGRQPQNTSTEQSKADWSQIGSARTNALLAAGVSVPQIHCITTGFMHSLAGFLWAIGIHADLETVRKQIGKSGDELIPVFVPWWKRKHVEEALKSFRAHIFPTDYLPEVKPLPKIREFHAASS